jgi:(p)ppGpp synthase/HD superfamily hydrolase
MEEWITVPKPADAAARWHVHQRRKGAAKEPYINHLLEVASLVAAATHGKDPNLVIAALLHDAIEDCVRFLTSWSQMPSAPIWPILCWS